MQIFNFYSKLLGFFCCLLIAHQVDAQSFVTNGSNIVTSGFSNSTGRLGIGTTTPGTIIETKGEGSSYPQGQWRATFCNNSNTDGASFAWIRGRGTIASPLSVVNGDYIGVMYGFAYTASNNIQSAAVMGFRVDGVVSPGIAPTKFELMTGNSSATRAIRFEVSSAGVVRIRNLAGGAVGTKQVTMADSYGNLTATSLVGTGNRMVIATPTGDVSSQAIPVSSQWTTSGANISYVSGGVGIGTATPTAPLQVAATSTMTYPQAKLTEISASNYSRLTFDNTTSSNYWTLAGLNTPSTFNNRFNFYYSGYGDIMSMTGSGYVGINNTNPSTRLSVTGMVQDTVGYEFGGGFPPVSYRTNGAFSIVEQATSNPKSLVFDPDEIQTRNNPSFEGVLHLQRKGGDIAMTKGGGKVFVGTDYAEAKLNVKSSSTMTEPQVLVEEANDDYARISFRNINHGSNANYWTIAGYNHATAASSDRLNFYNSRGGDVMSLTGGGQVAIGTLSPDGGAKVQINNNNSFGAWTPALLLRGQTNSQTTNIQMGNQVDATVWDMSSVSNPSIGTGKYALNYFPSGTTGTLYEYFTVLNNGNTGIGVVNPVNKLEVCGTIRATEVRVQTGWCDHVFSPSYKLPSLESVKSYIETHQRLPEVTSGDEIERDGLLVGNGMQEQMRKIEELTLYVIEQNEKLKTEQMKNETQNALLQRLTERLDALEKENQALKNKAQTIEQR